MNSAMHGYLVAAIVVTVGLIVAGCGYQFHVRPPLSTALPAVDRSLLAGDWEYEDGGTVMLQLDEQGNGTYAFKGGRFETTQFDGQTWTGKWYQQDNDRDGGFLVKLSADYTEGEGTWWYDRIGVDTSPSKKGGTFHLNRKASLTSRSETPPPP